MTAINPLHFSISFSHVVFELPFVDIAINPDEGPISCLFVFFEVPLILVSLLINPWACSFSKSSDEISLISGTVFPSILSIAMGVSIFVHPFVDVSIFEGLVAFSMFDELAELP